MTRKAQYLARGSRAASTFDNTYQTLGNALTSPAVLIKVVNDTDTDLDVSVDGTNDHDYVPSGSFFLYDMRTNRGREHEFVFRTGTQFYVKGAAAGTGTVYLVVLVEAS